MATLSTPVSFCEGMIVDIGCWNSRKWSEEKNRLIDVKYVKIISSSLGSRLLAIAFKKQSTICRDAPEPYNPANWCKNIRNYNYKVSSRSRSLPYLLTDVGSRFWILMRQSFTWLIIRAKGQVR